MNYCARRTMRRMMVGFPSMIVWGFIMLAFDPELGVPLLIFGIIGTVVIFLVYRRQKKDTAIKQTYQMQNMYQQPANQSYTTQQFGQYDQQKPTFSSPETNTTAVSSSTKHCNNCGAEIDDTDKFCVNCGQVVN